MVLGAVFVSCSAYSDTISILVHLTFVVCIRSNHFDLPLAMLKLVLLSEHVLVWQEVQVEVYCHCLRVLMKGFDFVHNSDYFSSFLLANRQIKRWARNCNKIGALDLCLQCRQCLCDQIDIDIFRFPSVGHLFELPVLLGLFEAGNQGVSLPYAAAFGCAGIH